MSQRAWEREQRYYGSGPRNVKPRRTIVNEKTSRELRAKVKAVLTQEPRTAGEIHRELESDPEMWKISRDAVRRNLDDLVVSGDAWLSRKDVTRNGHLVKDAAHYQEIVF